MVYRYFILTDNNMETHVHARMAGKLLILCNTDDLHHLICTTLLYIILFTKSKNIYLFSFYSTKCPPRFNFKNAKLNKTFSFTGNALHEVVGYAAQSYKTEFKI